MPLLKLDILYACGASLVAFICNHIRYIFSFNFRFTSYQISENAEDNEAMLTIRLSSPESSILNIAPSNPLGGAVTKLSNSVLGKK
jgi:hypothetical protein